jgi:quinoprotein dehydrogenase-associated probable ABC transporter substrate-binding protein
MLVFFSAGAAERELRVCADPDNLPYSREDGTGFENRIAQLLAAELHAKLTYAWLPQRRAFVRKTLDARLCDVIVGVPENFEPVRTTRPYYRSVFVFAYRAQGARAYRAFDDPQLASAKIGVQLVGNDLAATPPGHALAARGLVDNVVGYVVYGDRPQAERMIESVANGTLDVAILWGPPAAYFARAQRVPIALAPAHAPPELAAVPFEYSMSLGVRKGDVDLQHELDAVLLRRRDEIDAILDQYGVPRADAPHAQSAQVTQ